MVDMDDSYLSGRETLSLSGRPGSFANSRSDLGQHNSHLSGDIESSRKRLHGSTTRRGGVWCCLPFFFQSADPNDLVAEPSRDPSTDGNSPIPRSQAGSSEEEPARGRPKQAPSGQVTEVEVQFASSGVGATWYRKMCEADLKEDLIDGLKGETSEETEKRMRAAFQSTDADGSGGIDADELYEALRRIDIEATREEAASMVREADTDGSGTIEFHEFRVMVLRLMAQQSTHKQCHCKGGEICTCGATHPTAAS
jgi:troponin C